MVRYFSFNKFLVVKIPRVSEFSLKILFLRIHRKIRSEKTKRGRYCEELRWVQSIVFTSEFNSFRLFCYKFES